MITGSILCVHFINSYYISQLYDGNLGDISEESQGSERPQREWHSSVLKQWQFVLLHALLFTRKRILLSWVWSWLVWGLSLCVYQEERDQSALFKLYKDIMGKGTPWETINAQQLNQSQRLSNLFQMRKNWRQEDLAWFLTDFTLSFPAVTN